MQMLARKAVAQGSSLQATLYLRDHVWQLSSHQRFFLLPVFYQNLDPTHIPTLDRLDSPVPLHSIHVSKGYTSLLALFAMENLPLDIFAAIWPRIWIWVDFVQTYCEYLYLSDSFSPSPPDICFAFFLFIVPYFRDNAATDLMARSPGLRFVVARAWTVLVEIRKPEVLRVAFPGLAEFIFGPLVDNDRGHIQELIDGIGGELVHVASLVMRSLHILLGEIESTVSVLNSFALHGIVSFVMKVDVCMGMQEEASEAGPLSAQLLSRGIACDNLQCNKIRGKNTFRRCAQCCSVYYCSETCQAFDWRHGGHRDLCESYQMICLTKYDGLSPHDRAFFRALLHHDYQALKADIFARMLRFMNEKPGQRLVVLFDYRLGPVSVTVEEFLAPCEHPQLPYQVPGAPSCEGRLEVNVMQVGLGRTTLCWFIPMRRDSTQVYDSLQRIARELPQEQQISETVLQSMLSVSAEGIEIH
ncbi:MYND-type domain-containing protein [Mycena venus]|uniref:MYND-type domain-containing protein n=1 Tax=Mycena venus TaxID=2733690 RepID=A0A8H6Z429_9AGAR|nr:MYND-type domain-containing protein [Mycena venus]